MRLIRKSAFQTLVQAYLHVRKRTYVLPEAVCGAPAEAVLAFMIADPEYDDWLVGEDRDPLPEGWTPPPLPEGAVTHPPQHGPFALEHLSPDGYERVDLDAMLRGLRGIIAVDDLRCHPPHSVRDYPLSLQAWEDLNAWAGSAAGRDIEVFRLSLDDEDYLVSGEWAVQDQFVEHVIVDRSECELTLVIALIN